MSLPDNHRTTRTFLWALALSLLVHGGVLFLVPLAPPPEERPVPRMEARLGKRPAAAPFQAKPSPLPEAPPSVPPKAANASRPRVMTAEKPRVPTRPLPQRPAAEKEEMKRFLDELANAPGSGLDLAQSALAMARDFGTRRSQADEAGTVRVERLPDSPPVDPFSLEMYVDSLVKKLNRSAAFVRNDPRIRGLHTATVQIRIGPDGTLRTFLVLNAADQQDEVEFVRGVVERAVPFSPFPADIRKSAQSLAMTICILPARAGEGGFGFSRGGKDC